MCFNRIYTEQEQKNLEKLTSYAKQFLLGASIADVATAEKISESDVQQAICEIRDINPYLYIQIKAMLCGKEIVDGASLDEIAKKENTTYDVVCSWFEEIKRVDPNLYAKIMDKIDN